jgi:apolipoprotein N-acyltransferase
MTDATHRRSPSHHERVSAQRPSTTWYWLVLAAILSGALMASCYWPLNLHWLAWLAPVPWLLVLPKVPIPRVWLYGTVVGLVFYRLGLNWLFDLMAPLAVAAVVGLSLLMGFSFRVARLLTDRLGTAAMLWAVPLAFVGQEVLRCEGLSRYRFSFLAWGYSQAHNTWIAQIASIGGVYLLSFLLMAFSVSVAYALLRRRLAACIPAVATAGLVLVLGVFAQPRSHQSLPQISVACVQEESFNYPQFLRLTTQAAQHPSKPRCIVLPEHTITDYAEARLPFVASPMKLARDSSVYICVGAHVRAAQDAACDYDNVALLIGPDGQILTQQRKAVPIPFMYDGNPAQTQATTETPYGHLGTYVCYDGLFTDVPRRLVARRADLILVPVMDPCRWPLQERWQHADMAPFRSIELRRCTVRAASSGISQIIDATGRVLAQRTREDGAGVLYGSVYFTSEQTVFVRGGYLFAVLVGVGFLVLVAALTVVDWITRISKWSRARRVGSTGCL